MGRCFILNKKTGEKEEVSETNIGGDPMASGDGYTAVNNLGAGADLEKLKDNEALRQQSLEELKQTQKQLFEQGGGKDLGKLKKDEKAPGRDGGAVEGYGPDYYAAFDKAMPIKTTEEGAPGQAFPSNPFGLTSKEEAKDMWNSSINSQKTMQQKLDPATLVAIGIPMDMQVAASGVTGVDPTRTILKNIEKVSAADLIKNAPEYVKAALELPDANKTELLQAELLKLKSKDNVWNFIQTVMSEDPEAAKQLVQDPKIQMMVLETHGIDLVKTYKFYQENAFKDPATGQTMVKWSGKTFAEGLDAGVAPYKSYIATNATEVAKEEKTYSDYETTGKSPWKGVSAVAELGKALIGEPSSQVSYPQTDFMAKIAKELDKESVGDQFGATYNATALLGKEWVDGWKKVATTPTNVPDLIKKDVVDQQTINNREYSTTIVWSAPLGINGKASVVGAGGAIINPFTKEIINPTIDDKFSIDTGTAKKPFVQSTVIFIKPDLIANLIVDALSHGASKSELSAFIKDNYFNPTLWAFSTKIPTTQPGQPWIGDLSSFEKWKGLQTSGELTQIETAYGYKGKGGDINLSNVAYDAKKGDGAEVAQAVWDRYKNAVKGLEPPDLAGNAGTPGGSGPGGGGGKSGAAAPGSGQIMVNSDIPGSKVYAIDPKTGKEILIGDVNKPIDLPLGNYEIIVKSPGYEDVKKLVAVTKYPYTMDAKKSDLDKKSGGTENGEEEEGGAVYVASDTPGAKVYYKNEKGELILLGDANKEIDLENGKYTFVIKAEGYNDYTIVGEINDKTWTINRDLYKIETKEETEKKTSGTTGGYTGGSGGGGYSGGGTGGGTTPQPTTGKLLVHTNVRADIWTKIGDADQLIGKTEIPIELTKGTYLVTLKATGYKQYSFTINIYSGYTTERTYVLYEESTTPPETGQTGVRINTGSITGDVYVNGTKVGTTNTFIELAPGTYAITMVKTGYKQFTVSLTVVQGQTNTKTYTFYPEEGEEEEELPPVIIGAKLTFTGKSVLPNPLKVGEENWFGIEVKNTGDATWKGYIGVKLIDAAGQTYRYEGNAQYTQSVAPNETKMLMVKWLVPDTVVTGNVKVSILIKPV